MSEAMGDLDISQLLVEGKSLKGDLRGAITDASVTRTIDGCPTLTVVTSDPRKVLLRSGLFDSAVTTQLSPYAFEMAQLKKQGTQLTVVFEELTVALLRRKDDPRKIEAGQMTRAAFIRSLALEVPGTKFRDLSGPAEAVKSELHRGDVAKEGSAPTKSATKRVLNNDQEDSWAAMGRMADEVQKRRFIAGPREVVYAADSVLTGGAPVYVFNDESQGIISINFDWDTGKLEATLTVSCFAKLWAVPPGAHVGIKDMGPVTGNGWIVSEISRSLFSEVATVKLVKGRPVLPEPEGTSSNNAADSEGEIDLPPGSVLTDLTTGGKYIRPVSAAITSPFGRREGRMHYGTDFGCAVGTPVKCVRNGTIIKQATDEDGYGWYTDVQHGDDIVSRYAHLSQRGDWSRGDSIDQGEIIGLSGGKKGAKGAGNSRGPHLHFELHRKGVPFDAMTLLGAL